MGHKKREAVAPSVELPLFSVLHSKESCNCLPLFSLYAVPPVNAEHDDGEKAVPATPVLGEQLSIVLSRLFPRSTPLSMLLLHVSQVEHIAISAQSATPRRCWRCHASTSLLEQILASVRRAVRVDDQFLVHEGVGAALLFPDVDRHGAQLVLERVYRNICLLQSETVIPPLTRETDIVLSMSSYPEPGASLEQFLYYTGPVARRLVLRPAITTHLWNMPTISTVEAPPDERSRSNHGEIQCDFNTASAAASTRVPFMELPRELSVRLKHLIPHSIALQYRCAPVGRDHHYLTVAMANPSNSECIQRLHELTGMTIFPVSCEEDALESLLANEW